MADRHSGTLMALGGILVTAGGIFMAVTGFEPSKVPRPVTANAWFDVGLGFVIFGLLIAAVGAYLHFREKTPPERTKDAAPVLPAVIETQSTPVDVSVVHKVDGDRLRLVVTNEGPRGEFTVEVISVLDPDGRPVERQSWTVPWVGDDSVADILHSGSRTLDFARFVPDEGQWPNRAFWEFFSLPGPGRIAVMYKSVADKRELAPERFVVTVRIIQPESSPDHTDMQFAIGVTEDGHLMCDPVGDRAPDAVSSLLAEVRDRLLPRGRSLHGSLVNRPAAFGNAIPPTLQSGVEGWVMDARTALAPRADLCRQFDDAWNTQFATTQDAVGNLGNELTARLKALEAIERQLMEEGTRD